MNFPVKQIFVDQAVASLPETLRLTEGSDVPVEVIDDVKALYGILMNTLDPVEAGKKILFLTKNKGAFIKKCPGTKYYNCCGYMILHVGTFCHMDCSYCILQSYFHPPVLQYFVNRQEMLAELQEEFQKGKIQRIGTGEFTDSLIWEPFSKITEELVPRFAAQSKAVLELKTKTVEIQNLHQYDHNRKTILAWSLNTPRIIHSEERNTTSLGDRLAAAKTCEAMGYPLAFHFDPIVLYEGCEAEYREVIETLFEAVSPDSIVWISLGTFRFMPDLKSILQKRFSESKIPYGEFITGLDNKMRYFKPLRMAFYRKMVQWIREAAPRVLVYYCMEDDEVWNKTMGFTPAEKGGLPAMLDRSAMDHCGLDVL
ncbi:MAG: DNA photolyase [Proteobacteria bacterium]|nr:DNA photolyase [Pseudomonadota bacterium]